MALDIISQIRSSEAAASESMLESKNAAAKLIADAETAGKKLVENTRLEEEKKLDAYRTELAADAEKRIEAGRVESLAQCEMTKNAAASKLELSADAVCERIVGKKCR